MQLQPSQIGTKNGKPAIAWWRHGVAAAGEPRVVTEVRTYPDVATRDQVFLDAPRPVAHTVS